MDQSVVDRRVDARFPAEAIARRATLRPGCLVVVVDWSAGGALVQAPKPLRPGSRVYLQIVTERRTFALAAHVLRCAVWALDPCEGVTYRGALKFEDRCEMFWEETTHRGSVVPAAAHPAGRPAEHDLPVQRAHRPLVRGRDAK